MLLQLVATAFDMPGTLSRAEHGAQRAGRFDFVGAGGAELVRRIAADRAFAIATGPADELTRALALAGETERAHRATVRPSHVRRNFSWAQCVRSRAARAGSPTPSVGSPPAPGSAAPGPAW